MAGKYFDLIKSPLSGTNLIEASAGTGKTYVIAGLFLRLILEKGLPVDKILAVTYTEAATEELRRRIRDRLKTALKAIRSADSAANDENDDLLAWAVKKYKGSEAAVLRLKDALTRFDEASVCTIHGFCRRTLSENAFESNTLFNAELITDQTDFLRNIAEDFWRINFYSASSLLINFTLKKGIGPSYFQNLLKNFSIDPDFKIIPQLKKPDVPDIEVRFCNAYNELGKQWQLFKTEITDLLLTCESLSRTKYNTKYIPKWIAEAESYFCSENPVAVPEKLEKFTRSSITGGCKNGFEVPEHKFFNACEDLYGIYADLITVLSSYLLYLENEFYKFYKLESEKRKQNLNILAFDDLLVNMRKALADGEGGVLARTVRARYSAALIDEFQDTDPVQYDIFRIIFGNGINILFLIGDPKQSIYKFRGADIFAYLRASADIKLQYTLGTNWRSDPALVRAVNTIFKNKEDPFVLKEIEFNEVSPAGHKERSELLIDGKTEHPFFIRIIDESFADMKDNVVSKGSAETAVSKAVAAEICSLISLGREGRAIIGSEGKRPEAKRPEAKRPEAKRPQALKAGHIAVLVRKRHQAWTVKTELAALNIPAVLYGSESVFISHEATEMKRLLTAVADPGNAYAFRAALATDMIGLSGNDIFNLNDKESELEDLLNRFFEYHELWVSRSFYYMFRYLLDRERIGERLLSFPDGERRMTNITHLAELVHNAENAGKLGMDGVVRWLVERINRRDESEEHEIRLETDDDAVKLITIHRSKGLEFPVVFCPFMWDGSAVEDGRAFTFHDPEDNYNLTLDIGSSEEKNLKAAGIEELAENMRLLYVALTRAKYRTYLFWGRINNSDTSALSYILHHKGACPEDIESLLNSVKYMSRDALEKDISDLVKISGGAIVSANIPRTESRPLRKETVTDIVFQARIFNARIRKDWKISSFSSLTGGHLTSSQMTYGQMMHGQTEGSELPDHDSVDKAKETEITGESFNIFNFPGGANSGTCIHKIFEKLDFSYFQKEKSGELIGSLLEKYGIAKNWLDAVSSMIDAVIKTPLICNSPDLALCNITPDRRLNELEFYFPLKGVTSKGLGDVFRKSGLSAENFSVSLDHLGFSPHRGLVKGFIDMVFEYNDKYYIIDWKSNYLGNTIHDYGPDRLQKVMEDNYYILQYYFYTVALHRFLSIRKPGYDYDKDFGGIFYMFIRGVNKGSGIYHDVPVKSVVESLADYLCGK